MSHQVDSHTHTSFPFNYGFAELGDPVLLRYHRVEVSRGPDCSAKVEICIFFINFVKRAHCPSNLVLPKKKDGQEFYSVSISIKLKF